VRQTPLRRGSSWLKRSRFDCDRAVCDAEQTGDLIARTVAA